MSQVFELLKRQMDHVTLDRDVRDAAVAFQQQARRLKDVQNDHDAALRKLQTACKHPVILQPAETAPRSGSMRTCMVCGAWENQPVAESGDEHDYATFGAFVKLADLPGIGVNREFWKVDEVECIRARR